MTTEKDDSSPDVSGDQVLVEVTHPTRTLDTQALERLVRHAAQSEGFVLHYVGVILTGHAEVHALNQQFLGHDWETDVVSFPLDDAALAERVIDGEVYVDLDTASERAPEFGTTFENEARRYVVHGLLHLMGYDDATDVERATMRALEDRYLRHGASEAG